MLGPKFVDGGVAQMKGASPGKTVDAKLAIVALPQGGAPLSENAMPWALEKCNGKVLPLVMENHWSSAALITARAMVNGRALKAD